MSRSGPARAGTPLRRLVLRVLALAGFTAAAWLLGMLLTAGTASADTQTKPSSHSTQSAGSGKNSGNQGLGGLVGGLLNTVGGTVQNVTATVNTTVANTVGLVKSTVNTVTTTVTSTVNTVVHTVTELPQQVLPNNGSSSDGDNGNGILSPLLPNNPLKPSTKPSTKTTDTTAATVRTDAPAAAVATPDPAVSTPAAPVDAAPVLDVQHARTHVTRPVELNSTAHAATSSALEQAAPAGKGPGPLPGPSGPDAPAAPCPSFSSGNHGGSGARGALAVLAGHARLAPPPLVGRLGRAHPAVERGHTPGLPVTSPD